MIENNPESVASSPAQSALSSLPGLLELGGPVMYILLGMSVVALAIILVKLFQFWMLRSGGRGFITPVIEHYRVGNVKHALQVLSQERNPIARVLEVAIAGDTRRDVNYEMVREEVDRVAGDQLENLRSHLRGLEVIATLSPLLGLFGTVLGMIEAFRRLEQAGNQVSASILSGGIWEALLTTAAGLAIAIPTVAVLNWLERSLERLGHDMESAVTQIFTTDLRHPVGDHELPGVVPARRSLFD
ncbi:MAG: MotA/TolQ/ExbB proton channel family protein [Gammaproteobacteria bacterium]|nr:MotA/TolQ/ExbB proton channel family protein [Gammaproteobacteria bacterium]